MEMRILAFFNVFIVLSGFLFDIREPLSQDELAKRHRIITLSPHLAEIVYASGAGDSVTTEYMEELVNIYTLALG